MIRIGLTGGIASGKSTVAGILARHGALIVDADAISRQTTATGGSAIEQIKQEFGPAFITAHGSLDRERMRELIFSQPQARLRLEAIVHPLVTQETRLQTEQALAQGIICLVYDVPLLVESGRWRSQLDKILVVDCDTEIQIERSHQRSGLDRSAVEKILSSQTTRILRLGAADMVICNSYLSLEDLAHEVAQISSCFGL